MMSIAIQFNDGGISQHIVQVNLHATVWDGAISIHIFILK